MSLANRLAAMERRLADLEKWKAGIEAAIEAEEQDDQPEPETTLDGEVVGIERDQTMGLDG